MGIVFTGVRAERAPQPKWSGMATAVDTLAGIVGTPVTALDQRQADPAAMETRRRGRRRLGDIGPALEPALLALGTFGVFHAEAEPP